MKETPKTQTWRVDGDALKAFLKSRVEWSFIRRADIESWAHGTQGDRGKWGAEIYDDMISDFATNCIAYAKRHKWIRCRAGRPRMWQVLPIA